MSANPAVAQPAPTLAGTFTASGGTLTYFNRVFRVAEGTVTFDHEQHASRGYVCADCHTRLPATGNQLFETHKQGLISVADHSSDGKCFACHNGEVAFATCEQCHR